MQVSSGKCGLLAALTMTIAVSGCAETTRVPKLPPLHPASGSVKYRGQPAAAFRVTFHPLFDIGPTKFHPYAITDQAGNFQVTSQQPGDGLPEGEYAVNFEWPDHFIQNTDPDPVPEVDKLRGAYHKAEQSPFKVHVKPGENPLPVFELR